jgi:hypothetical protein
MAAGQSIPRRAAVSVRLGQYAAGWEAVEKLAVLKAATESLLAAQPDDDDR